jgi:hypothetical protein
MVPCLDKLRDQARVLEAVPTGLIDMCKVNIVSPANVCKVNIASSANKERVKPNSNRSFQAWARGHHRQY